MLAPEVLASVHHDCECSITPKVARMSEVICGVKAEKKTRMSLRSSGLRSLGHFLEVAVLAFKVFDGFLGRVDALGLRFVRAS